MFLTLCSPISSSKYGSLSRICSRTVRETQMPPGSASASKRAAILTPSPKMSPPSRMTSPRLIPHTKFDAALGGHVRFAVDHSALHLGSTAHRVHDAREFHQHP